MKIRTGFVSNSSSSSFILALPRGLALDAASIHGYLYGEVPVKLGYGDTWTTPVTITSTEAAAAIAEQLAEQPADADLTLMVWGAVYEDAPTDPGIIKLSGEKPDFAAYKSSWDAYHAACLAHGKASRPGLAAALGGDYVLYVVEFEDYDEETDPIGTVMRDSPTAFGAAKVWERKYG